MDHSKFFCLINVRIVPDDAENIKKSVLEASLSPNVQLILVSGGTGFTPDDVTPEAVT